MKARGRRVLFLWSSAHRLGGLATWLDYLLPALEQRGWSPVLGLLEGPRYNRPEKYLADHPFDSWISVPCVTGTPEGRCRAVAQAVRATRPDLVIGINTPDAYSAIARLRREGSHARVAMTVHGIEPGLYGDVKRFRDVLDGVVGSNRLVCRLAADLGEMDASRIHYAPYGLETPADLTSDRDVGTVLRIGFVGRIVETQKRVGDLVSVSRALAHASISHELLIAGGGPEESRLRRSLDAERLVFLGWLADAELSRTVYWKVDALLITSEWETGPLVAWEAMAHGVPVVSSRFVGSGLEGSLLDGQNVLLFEIGDAEAAADHLARLRTDARLRERIRAGGLELVQSRYSRVHSVEAWERCFEVILDAPGRPAGSDPAVPGATGRLERLLSAGAAETLRDLLRKKGPNAGTAGEWPHTYGFDMSAEAFMAYASKVDQVGRPDA